MCAVPVTTLLLGSLLACSDEAQPSPPGGGSPPTTSSTVPDGGVGGATTSTASSGGSSTGSAGSGGSEPVCPAGGFAPYVPTPASIDFEPVAPIPPGEQILFNTWDSPTDGLYSMTPDGESTTEIFRAYRVWSLGVAHAGDRLAFACGDPRQPEHFGVQVLDAIQHTWLYDFATESLTLLADGAINDECHQFSADDTSLYVCRRYDWECDPDTYASSKGYRIARIEVATGDFAFVTGASSYHLALHPQPNAAESHMLYTRLSLEGDEQRRTVMQMDLPSGTPSELRLDSSAPLLAPDGLRYLYTDTAEREDNQLEGWLRASDLDGNNDVVVLEGRATSVRLSPDGTRVVYLRWDASAGCSHIETVAVDGSEALAPTRIRDCDATGEFITEVAWFVRP